VRSVTSEDANARGGRARRDTDRAHETDAGSPRETLHPERVELESSGGHEPSFDVVRRTGEADGHAAFRERFRDRERGQNVAGGPARCDEAPELLPLRH
jgi:hypothetical protein